MKGLPNRIILALCLGLPLGLIGIRAACADDKAQSPTNTTPTANQEKPQTSAPVSNANLTSIAPSPEPAGAPAASNSPTAAVDPTAYRAFEKASRVMTRFLIVITAVVIVLIIIAIIFNKWSLGDALSEECAFQPKEIKRKEDVILLASTSRIIALFGLMGILTVVIGVGYSIVWNLTIYGRVPDLTEVRSFLLGAACLFAPYLANQLSGMFTPAAKLQPALADTMSVSGVAPSSPKADNAAQALHLIGTGFQQGLSLTLTDPQGTAHSVSAADVTSVTPTLASANATLNTPGAWKVAVANPSAATSPSFAFAVVGPPAIASATAGLHVNAAAQSVTFAGSGFVSGLKVDLTDPAGTKTTFAADQLNTTQVTVAAVLASAGNWHAVITNPGNLASNNFPFTVA